ncbi:hypothetical protein R1sor_001838 [Riccia sorocarpa]|uniref:Uncharacterized protein n=1 Tax=Riccia sorocarpa TaxID=122646 RepID=A0ABD3H198_9MARC
MPTRRPDGILDYSGVSLGTLMRHAGAEWTGGELGLRTLSSLESILNTYRVVGMASVVRWRLCIGVSDTRHAAVPFGESSQDEYIQSRGENCRTLCEEMLSMWRARDRWIGYDGDLSPSYPIKEWWDGTKAKEVAWFFDSRCEFELPVVCPSCYEVYKAYPEACEELSNQDNFNIESQTYEVRVPAADGGLTSSVRQARLRLFIFFLESDRD